MRLNYWLFFSKNMNGVASKITFKFFHFFLFDPFFFLTNTDS